MNIEEYNIDINVLGLRSLVSAGLLPVKKAFCKFSVKSILPPAQAKAVSDIYTSPDEGGEDPNIRTTLKLTANIPSDPYYCPRMTCTAYDKLYFEGMAQPIIGTFTLKLGDILTATRNKDTATMEGLAELLQAMQGALEAKRGPDKDKTILQILQQDKSISRSKSMVLEDGAKLGASAVDVNGIKLSEGPEQAKTSSRKQAREKHEAEAAAKKAADAAERAAAQEELDNSKDGVSNVIYPKYKYDERLKVDREVEFPPENLFMPLGYNKNPEDKETKHYRRYYPDELENIREVMPASPFLHEDINRMEQSGGGMFGGGNDAQHNTTRRTGVFKGLVAVYNPIRLAARQARIQEGFAKLRTLAADVYQE